MALLLARRGVVGHQCDVDELVAHVDEGVALTFAAQGEIEDLRVPGQRLVDIPDLDRDMVDADEPRFCFGHWIAFQIRAPMRVTLYRRGRGGFAKGAKAPQISFAPS